MTIRAWCQYQYSIGFVATGEVKEIGTGAKVVVGVIRAHLQVARRNDQNLTGEECA